MRLLVLFGALMVLAEPAAAGAESRLASSLVRTVDGPVKGRAEGDAVAFKGIPFAAAPVGALRWRPPTPPGPWKAVRNADSYSPACAQAAFDWNRAIAEGSREDCLYLNVWVPKTKTRLPLPVIVFFPGGANHGGSARGLSSIEPSYDGARLAAKGVMVVTANYRVGILGFLAHPDLARESGRGASGDYGLMDQLAALRWVQANAQRFGGDPGNVTAMGQSAGSFDLGALLTSPLTPGLFSKVVMMSGPIVPETEFLPTEAEAETSGSELAATLGAPAEGAIEALRARPAKDLLKSFELGGPLRGKEPKVSVDGYVLGEEPALAFADGRELKVPMLIGTGAREGDYGSMGVKGTPKAVAARADRSRPLSNSHLIGPASPQELATIGSYFKGDAELSERAIHLYGDPTRVNPVDGDVAVAFRTDLMRCLGLVEARWHARNAPTWVYQFSHGYEPLGAVHLWDLQYLFGSLTPPADQPRDFRLSQQMQLYLTSFARSGSPAPPGLPKWPKVGDNNPYLDFTSAGAEARTGLRADACRIIEKRALEMAAAYRSQRPTSPSQ